MSTVRIQPNGEPPAAKKLLVAILFIALVLFLFKLLGVT